MTAEESLSATRLIADAREVTGRFWAGASTLAELSTRAVERTYGLAGVQKCICSRQAFGSFAENFGSRSFKYTAGLSCSLFKCNEVKVSRKE